MGEGIELTLDAYRNYEGNSVVLLDADYLKVLDIPSTQGIVPGYCKEALVPCFWFTMTIIYRSKNHVMSLPTKKEIKERLDIFTVVERW